MKEKCDPLFVTKLQQEVRILNNICFILDKVNTDGFLHKLQQSLSDMIDNELKFAMRELMKFDQRIKPTEFKNQLINNTYIFKENLKGISHYMGSFISRLHLEGKGEGQLPRTGYPGRASCQ